MKSRRGRVVPVNMQSLVPKFLRLFSFDNPLATVFFGGG